MATSTAVSVSIITVVSNTCDNCGAELKNPQHKFCADCFKQLPRSAKPRARPLANDVAKPAAAPKAAPTPVAIPATTVVTATPVATPGPALAAPTAPIQAPKAETKTAVVVKRCECNALFIPRDPRHDKCTACHRKEMKLATSTAKTAGAKSCDAERRLEAEKKFKADLLAAFRAGKHPEAKVNGPQVVIVANGKSYTLYDMEGFNARREAERQAEAAKAKAEADKTRAETALMQAKAERHDRIAKTLLKTLRSGKPLPCTVTAAQEGAKITFTVKPFGRAARQYVATDTEMAARLEADNRAAEARARAAGKAEAKGGKQSKARRAA